MLAAAASLVPAYLSYRYVEQPGQRARSFATTGGGLRLGLVATLAGGVAALSLVALPGQQTASGTTVDASGTGRDVNGNVIEVGAQVLGLTPLDNPAGAPRDSFESITPDPATAITADLPANGNCSLVVTDSTDVPCAFGDLSSRVQVDLLGDSHAMQWQPALTAVAERRHWRVVTHTKSACPFTAAVVTLQGRPYRSCSIWNDNVVSAIIRERPTLVLTTQLGENPAYRDGHTLSGAADRQAQIEGYLTAWRRLTDAGIHVVAIAQDPGAGERSSSTASRRTCTT